MGQCLFLNLSEAGRQGEKLLQIRDGERRRDVMSRRAERGHMQARFLALVLCPGLDENGGCSQQFLVKMELRWPIF